MAKKKDKTVFVCQSVDMRAHMDGSVHMWSVEFFRRGKSCVLSQRRRQEEDYRQRKTYAAEPGGHERIQEG